MSNSQALGPFETLELDKNASLDQVAAFLRGRVVQMSHAAKTPHLGSCLSCVDILAAAYWEVLKLNLDNPMSDNRDRFILSKGHAAMALYASLAYRGFADPEVLTSYNRPGSSLAEHPGPWCMPGVEAATGSLGHGLGIGIGMALAGRLTQRDYRVFVLLSDGECNEGSVWEGAMMAAAQGLSNLTAIVDFNKWQATGRSREVLALDPLVDKWHAFGWQAEEVDGHDLSGLVEHLRRLSSGGKPRVFVAHTIKGKGISFMEDDNNWHYRIPSQDEVMLACKELGLL